MDGLTFFKLINILKDKLIFATLNKLSILNSSVYISVYKEGSLNLEFRTAPTPPVLMKVSVSIGSSPGALSAVSGSIIDDLYTSGYERIAFIRVKKRKSSGVLTYYTLVLEPMGNYANFFLLGEDDTILYSLSSRTIDPDRSIGVGSVYSRPRLNKQFSLDNYDEFIDFNNLIGFYPTTSKHANELALKIGSKDKVVNSIKEALIRDNLFYIDNFNKVIPFPIMFYKKTITWEELANYYQSKGQSDSNSKTLEVIKKYFIKYKDKYERLIYKLSIELEAAKSSDKYMNEAELIKANLYKVTSNGKYIFERYTEAGVEAVSYSVEYGENLSNKADKLFKKATRLKRSIPLIEKRLEEYNQLLLSAKEQLDYIFEQPFDDTDLFAKLILSGNSNKGDNKSKKEDINIFYQIKKDNYDIFIGKSSVSNHKLVFHYAKDNDIWFHARNIPSAHLILRFNRNAKLTDNLIIFCAKIVAGYSKYKHELKVDVDYTLRKYVSKPKNTPIGFVTYKNFKTVIVEPYSQGYINKLVKK